MAEPIIVTASYAAPAETVWKAITEPSQMRQWFFQPMEDFEATVGFESRFDVHVNDRVFRHHWRVTAVTPQRSLTYDWLYDGYPGAGEVTWELDSTKGEGETTLTLTCRGIESFPQDIPEFKPESCRGGWEYFLNDSLAKYLAKV